MHRLIPAPSSRMPQCVDRRGGTMQIAEVMNRSLVGVAPETCVAVAHTLALGRGVGHLLVLDCDDLVGILSVHDLRKAGPEARVSEYMSSPVRTIRATASLAEARELMRRSDCGCLPVVAGGLLLGVVTRDRLAGVGRA